MANEIMPSLKLEDRFSLDELKAIKSAKSPEDLDLNLAKKMKAYLESPGVKESGPEPGIMQQYIEPGAAFIGRGLKRHLGFPVSEAETAQDVKTMAKALPTVGGVIGSLTGSPLAAGLGAGGGKALQQMVNAAVDTSQGQARTGITLPGVVEASKAPLIEGLISAGGQRIANNASAIISPLFEKISKVVGPRLKEGAGEIAKAAESLGFKAPKSLLSENPAITQAEQALEQSPTIIGRLTKGPAYAVEQTSKAASNLFDNAVNHSKFSLGENAKDRMVTGFASEFGQLRPVFESVSNETQNIALNHKGLNAIANNLLNHPDILVDQKGPLAPIASRFSDAIRNLKTVDQVKQLRTIVGKEMDAAYSTGSPTADFLSDVYSKLTGLENRSITRAAIEIAGEKQGPAAAKSLLEDIKLARIDWSGVSNRMRDLADALGLKGSRNLREFTARLEGMTEEQIASKLLNTNNFTVWKTVKKEFPDIFERMKESKLADIADKITQGNEALSPVRLVKILKSVPPEIQNELFSPESLSKIKNIEIIVKSLPPKLGPSGTPQGNWVNNLWTTFGDVKELTRLMSLKAESSPSTKRFFENLARSFDAEAVKQEALSKGGISLRPATGSTILQQTAGKPMVSTAIDQLSPSSLDAMKRRIQDANNR